MQYSLGISPELRSNFDYIFLLGEDIINNRKKDFRYNKVNKKIKEYQKFIKNNFDYVGENFVYEARSIHYKNKKSPKGIYGTATKEDLKELKEEGIETEEQLSKGFVKGISDAFSKSIDKYRYDRTKSYSPCIFEYVYISRAESIIDGVSVYKARENMGKYLAQKIKNTYSKEMLDKIDYIVPIPDTSRPTAIIISKILSCFIYDLTISYFFFINCLILADLPLSFLK